MHALTINQKPGFVIGRCECGDWYYRVNLFTESKREAVTAKVAALHVEHEAAVR